ncbi:hypothetical protein TRAPUB_11260 [Trametes pubescens]|uniref:Uncharacterized protein n=1 Tax=Trametes pubescens TaxID=154538 RepID=A0A1M2VX69_TRAPU|nr:hypothetical protein TRAPUB_11260 [Trametes pubescens]
MLSLARLGTRECESPELCGCVPLALLSAARRYEEDVPERTERMEAYVSEARKSVTFSEWTSSIVLNTRYLGALREIPLFLPVTGSRHVLHDSVCESCEGVGMSAIGGATGTMDFSPLERDDALRLTHVLLDYAEGGA